MAQKIQVRYEADISKLEKDLKKLETQQKKVGDQAKKTGETITNLSKKQAKQLEKLIALRKTAIRLGDNRKTVKILDQEIAALKKAGTATKKLTQETKKFQKQTNGLGNVLQNVGRNLAIAFSVGALIQFGKQLNRTALEMEAFQKRAAIVFGESISLIKDFAKENALALGLTEIEFQGATAAIADMIVPLGLSRQQAAEMSIELLKTGVALKEFTGDSRDASEISDILARALTGEVESLKPLGVSISQNSKEFKELVRVKIEDEGVTELQAKALAIYESILQRSSDAIVSLEENTDSLSLAQARLGANVRTLNEELAKLLTPVLKEASGAILKQVEFVNDSETAWGKLRKILQLTNAVTATATLINNALRKEIEETTAAVDPFALAMEELGITMEEVFGIIGSSITVQQAEIRNVFFLDKAIKELNKERKAQGTSLERIAEINKEIIPLQAEMNRLLDKQKKAVKEARSEWEGLEKAMQNVEDTSLELTPLIDDANIRQNIEAVQDFRIAIEQINFENLISGGELVQESLNAIAAIQEQNTNARIRQLETLGLTEEEFARQRDELIAEGETKQKALFLLNQVISAATIIIELQKEIALISAAPSLNIEPVTGAITKAALITGAKFRAAAGLTAIAGATVLGLEEGEVDIQGGVKGKDSIAALLMPGESVIKTKATGAYKEELLAANNLNLESLIHDKYVLPAIVKVRGEQAFAERWMQENAFDDTGIVRQMKKPVNIGNYKQMAKEIAKHSNDVNYFHP